MIRVTIELVPSDGSEPRVLGRMQICNDGTGDRDTGNYEAVLHAEYTPPAGRRGRVFAFSRQTQSVWSLVGALLKLWGHTRHSPTLMSKS